MKAILNFQSEKFAKVSTGSTSIIKFDDPPCRVLNEKKEKGPYRSFSPSYSHLLAISYYP